MDEQQTKAFESLQCEVIHLKIWLDGIYRRAGNLGTGKKPSLTNETVLKGADLFTVAPRLPELLKCGDVNAVADQLVDLTGVHFGDAKAAVRDRLS